jgi:quinoprotein glucose dehydrogenase
MLLTSITAWILILFGLSLGAGGAWLATLGGSWAYGIAGIALLVCGVLLILRRRSALGVYAALLVAMSVWSLWEVGFDRWALVPRGALLSVIGLWLLTPWISRTLRGRNWAAPPARPSWRGPRGWLAGVMLLVFAVAVISITRDPFDVPGALPDAPLAQAAAPVRTDLHTAAGDDWTAYGGTGQGQRYSSLADITPATVNRLAPAWVYHTGDMPRPSDPVERTFEVTPLKVGDLLYLCSVRQRAIALDAASGQERWHFDPQIGVGHTSQHLSCRGLAYYDSTGATTATATPALPEAPASVSVAPRPATCVRRILLSTIDARLFALDAQTGEPCLDFGNKGVVDLSVGMPNLSPGAYMQTSPPVVAGGLLIVGGSINDNELAHNPSGVIRAFDAVSGQLVWAFDPGNPDASGPLLPGQTYTAGAPNNWAPSSVDMQLGLVYIGLGNQSPDQLGAGRSKAVERFSSAVIALDVATGKLRWVYQTVHHDLWDRDVPAQASLIDLTIAGKVVPALVMPTKQGDLHVLDRRSGQPVLPVQELPTPASTIPGEFAAPTQPHSSLSFMPAKLTGKDMWGATPVDQMMCRIALRRMAYDGPYTPPSIQRTLVYPGNLGVFNWGGVAVDPVRQILVGTPARLAFTFQLLPRPDATANIVSAGASEHWNENHGSAYAVRIGPFMSTIGLPCQAPPWGAIAGVDLRTGQTAWMHRNGTVRDQMPSFLPIPFPMGVAGLGGPLITAGGVVFYSGTLDNYLRAYDVTTGRKLWESRLPAGGQATPMTYRIGGRQMVVVAAGGHGAFGTTLGDSIMAYELK